MRLPLLNRRFQFSLRTLLIFTVLIGLAFSLYVNWNAIQRRWWIYQLKAYANSDLLKLDEGPKGEVMQLLQNLTSRKQSESEATEQDLRWQLFLPLHLWQGPSDGELVLFEVDAVVSIPGKGTWRFTVFDGNGSIATKIQKDVSYRTWPYEAHFNYTSKESATLTIDVKGVNGGPISKRIYSYKNHDLKLIRLVDMEGNDLPLDGKYGDN
jgi:hypothetical protein